MVIVREGIGGGDTGGDSGAGKNSCGNSDNGVKRSGEENSDVEWTELDEDESVSKADLEERPLEFEKYETDEKIKYEIVDRQKGAYIQYLRDVHALQSLPQWDIQTLSKVNIINPHNIGIANFEERLIRRECNEGFSTFKPAKTIHRRSKKIIDPRTGKGKDLHL
ncbi:hypothetical protein L1987_33093 [Smallanthus sonchifolius]|uniref:Uncharacterized protein n=1 Tax=Smallanthus sonchifolius TaxID=185202 RepID=A0ACB9HPJ9_9ASTR|nr:hypothetical protein L1987_33093 [Smallanthus sonchifolius]